jgi:hypothetical protein
VKFVYGANDRSNVFQFGMRFNRCIVSFTVLCLLFGGILSVYDSELQNENGQVGIKLFEVLIFVEFLFKLSLSIKGKTSGRN